MCKVLEVEGLLRLITFSVPCQHLVVKTKAIHTIFAPGITLGTPEVQAFIASLGNVQAGGPGRVTKKPELADTDLAVEHMPGQATSSGEHMHLTRTKATRMRVTRLSYGLIEMKLARAIALHTFLWNRDGVGGGATVLAERAAPFAMDTLCRRMPLRAYAQLIGIADEVPGIDELFKKDTVMAEVPEPHRTRLLSGRAAFTSARSLLEILLKLGLLERVEVDLERALSSEHTEHSRLKLVHFATLPDLTCPRSGGGDDGGSGSAGQREEEVEMHSTMNSGALGQVGISASGTVASRRRVYDFGIPELLESYWADLQALAFEMIRLQRPRTPQDAAPTPQQVGERLGWPELTELFFMRNWQAARPLLPREAHELQAAVEAAGLRPPYDAADLYNVSLGLHRHLGLHNIIQHYLREQHPERGIGKLHAPTEPTLPRVLNNIGVKKKRRRRLPQATAETASSEADGSDELAVPTTHHAVAYAAIASVKKKRKLAVGAGCPPSMKADPVDLVDPAKASIVPELYTSRRRKPRYLWTHQMDTDLALAYVNERDRITRSDSAFRISWANVDAAVTASVARRGDAAPAASHLRRRWTVLQKEPFFRQAATLKAGSPELRAFLEMGMQAGPGGAQHQPPPLPSTVAEVQAHFLVSDGQAGPPPQPATLPTAVAALMQALRAVLLVPEQELEQPRAVALLGRFSATQLEGALQQLRAAKLLASRRDISRDSRVFRLSAKFDALCRGDAFDRSLFDRVRRANADGGLDLTAEADAIDGGGQVAAALAGLVAGALTLRPAGLAAAAEPREREPTDPREGRPHSLATQRSLLNQLLNKGAVHKLGVPGGSASQAANAGVQLPSWWIQADAWSSSADGSPQLSEQSAPPKAAASVLRQPTGRSDVGHHRSGRRRPPPQQKAAAAPPQAPVPPATALAPPAVPADELPAALLQAAAGAGLGNGLVRAVFAAVSAAGKDGARLAELPVAAANVGPSRLVT
jgi:hypothetical protein